MKRRRIELIIATAVLIFSLFILYSQNIKHFEFHQVMAQLGYATCIYGAFIAFNVWICYDYFRQKKYELAISLSLLLFFALWVSLAAFTWLMRDPAANSIWWSYIADPRSLGVSALCFAGYLAYEGIKSGIGYLKKQKGNLTARIANEFLILLGIGIPIFFLFMMVYRDAGALWLCSAPYAYILFALNTYWLIPLGEQKRFPIVVSLAISIGVSFVAFIPFGLLFINITNSVVFVYYLTWFCINLLILPLSYYIYANQKAGIAQLTNLKRELGQSSADVRFLRSQINPHFLFNILNTLFGIALQEKAERTSAGIQKLGDMMRFMLHENNQDQILLAREIDYLRNYIDLQLLRTATSPDIVVSCDIPDNLSATYITPMLLIPFVENAFKHGISLKQRSWIHISLRQEDEQLFFDVHNSVHNKPSADPEKDHKGIGLDNVKQRLALFYPGRRHELIIRQTAQEFFIHLTIRL